MPKTSDSVSQACAKLEIDPGLLGVWYDVGGEMSTVSGTKETRETGSTAVFNDDRHVVAGGKKPPITPTFSGVYSEEAAEAFELVRTLWESSGVSDCDKKLGVRWTPKGGSVGDKRYMMTDNPQLVGFQYPEMDAGSADPMMFEFDVFGYIDSETIAS